MIRIFISYAPEDATCVQQLCQGLEAQGYSTAKEPETLELDVPLDAYGTEIALLGSAAVVLVWSTHAARSTRVKQHIHLAQQLKKLLLFLVIDGTSVPAALSAISPVTSKTSCTDALPQLLALLPDVNSVEPLLEFYALATHGLIRKRKESIALAADLLKKEIHRDEVLAVLEYLVRNDSITRVRDLAKEVLAAETKTGEEQVKPSDQPTKHNFGVRCRKGHVTYFDKRVVCVASTPVLLETKQSANVELDELYLKCKTCGEEVVARVDCSEYRSRK